MRYWIDGNEIRTENTAKPVDQASRFLTSWLERNVGSVDTAVDYGCGKLRYSWLLHEKSKRLILVDSEIQLSRRQKLGNEHDSIRDLVVRQLPRAEPVAASDFDPQTVSAGFVLCANVLSAIPEQEARTAVVQRIRESLAPTGTCLFVTQFRDTYFREVAASGQARKYLDGWILRSNRGTYFYGLITEHSLGEHVAENGLVITRSWTKKDSAYVLCSRNEQ